MNTIFQKLQNNMSALKVKYPLQALGLYGSYSRGDENSTSDLDIIYETLPDTHLTLHSFLSLQHDLSNITDLKIDLVNKKYMNEVVWLTARKDILYV